MSAGYSVMIAIRLNESRIDDCKCKREGKIAHLGTEGAQCGDGQDSPGQEGQDIVDGCDEHGHAGLFHENADLLSGHRVRHDTIVIVQEKEHVVHADAQCQEGHDLEHIYT